MQITQDKFIQTRRKKEAWQVMLTSTTQFCADLDKQDVVGYLHTIANQIYDKEGETKHYEHRLEKRWKTAYHYMYCFIYNGTQH